MSSECPELPTEVWIKIITNLRRPPPRPTGKNDRSGVGQSPLATMMRVCKLFNNITAPILYKEAITDNLPSFIYNLKSPASATGIASKKQLLARVERLFLEYCSKEDVSYTTLMRYGGASFKLYKATDMELAEVCAAETDEMMHAAEAATDALPNLLTLSTCAIFGGQTSVWQPIWQIKPPVLNMAERMKYCRGAVCALIKQERMPYFCQHAMFGPLVYISQFWYAGTTPSPGWRGPKGIEHCVHIDAEAGNFPVIVGGNSRWYCTFSGAKSNYPIQEAGMSLVRAIGSHMLVRESAWNRVHQVRGPEAKYPFISVDAYLPPRFVEPDVLQMITGSTEESLAANPILRIAPASHTKGDRREYKSIASAPPCEACGWCTDDL